VPQDGGFNVSFWAALTIEDKVVFSHLVLSFNSQTLYPFEDLIPAYQRPKAMWNGVLAGGCVMVLTMLVEVCGLTRWIGLAHTLQLFRRSARIGPTGVDWSARSPAWRSVLYPEPAAVLPND